MKTCKICNRETQRNIIWALELSGLANLNVCEECSLSLKEQIMSILIENRRYFIGNKKLEIKI